MENVDVDVKSAASEDGLHVRGHDTTSEHTCDTIAKLKHDYPKPYENEQWVEIFFLFFNR